MKFDRARVEYLSHEVIGSAIEVHRRLGPGLLEEVYVRALLIELQHRKIAATDSQRVPLYYRDVQIGSPYVLDILVDGLVVVEVKAVAMLAAVHTAQLITYLRVGDFPAGLLLNFNVALMRNGIRRLDHPDVYRARPRVARATDPSEAQEKVVGRVGFIPE